MTYNVLMGDVKPYSLTHSLTRYLQLCVFYLYGSADVSLQVLKSPCSHFTVDHVLFRNRELLLLF